MCESASKAAVLASLRRVKGGSDLALQLEGRSWKQLTGWIGSPPAWCVLHELFVATDGPDGWEWKDGWAATDVDVAKWFGVSARYGRVVGLDLFGNGLHGSLPETIGSLGNLRDLVLHHNRLTGPIPESLGALRKLETLDLSANRLDGGLPASLGQCRSLEYLNVSSNRLVGEIPRGLFRHLRKLEALHLDHNDLSGCLPDDLDACAALEVLNCSHCALGGPLPVAVGKLRNLKALFLGHNKFVGALDVLAPLCGRPAHDAGADDDASADSRCDPAALTEVYVNDNHFDVDDVHPRLVEGLNVLFTVRNTPPPLLPPDDAGTPEGKEAAS